MATLGRLVEIDASISKFIAQRGASTRRICVYIEYGMHGVPWLIGALLLVILIAHRPFAAHSSNEAVVTLFCGLIVDLAIVGTTKVVCRRARPSYASQSDQFMPAPIADVFSMPSGHTTRATMLAVLAREYTALPLWLCTCVPLIVGISRVLCGRHYTSDVLVGLVFAYATTMVMLGVLPVHDMTRRLVEVDDA